MLCLTLLYTQCTVSSITDTPSAISYKCAFFILYFVVQLYLVLGCMSMLYLTIYSQNLVYIFRTRVVVIGFVSVQYGAGFRPSLHTFCGIVEERTL